MTLLRYHGHQMSKMRFLLFSLFWGTPTTFRSCGWRRNIAEFVEKVRKTAAKSSTHQPRKVEFTKKYLCIYRAMSNSWAGRRPTWKQGSVSAPRRGNGLNFLSPDYDWVRRPPTLKYDREVQKGLIEGNANTKLHLPVQKMRQLQNSCTTTRAKCSWMSIGSTYLRYIVSRHAFGGGWGTQWNKDYFFIKFFFS